MAQRHATSKKNVFWIASILIVIFLAIQIVTSTQVTKYDINDLGLLTKLPITFWVGLSYLGMLLYLGRKSELRTLAVVILIFFYLFCIPLLIRENKAEFLALSYGFSSAGAGVWSVGHLAFGTFEYLSLLNWPGFFILAGGLSGVTGLPATSFADYFPLLTISLMGIIVYSTLRLRLNMLVSCFGSLWFVASFWTSQYYFAPQGLAYLFYFAIFFLLAKLFFSDKQTLVLSLSALILFTGLVTTHLLTSAAITVSVLAIYVFLKFFPRKRRIAFYSIATCILLASILLAYQFFVINSSFTRIVELLYLQLSQGDTQLSAMSQARASTSPPLQMQLFGDYGITIINVVIALIAFLATALRIFYYKKEARNDLFWIAWIIIAGLIGVSVFYGGEVIQRAFILMLLPISYFAANFFSKKPRIMVIVLVTIVFLQVPAHYAWESWVYVPTSELKGTNFYQTYAPSAAKFLYEPDLGFFDEGRFNGTILSITVAVPSRTIPSAILINELIGQAQFIITSSQLNNFYEFFYGFDLLENQSFVDHYSQLYDNENFQIYAR
jgi:hypothetical protein